MPEQSYRLCVARPCGWKLESPEVGSWLFGLGYKLARQNVEIAYAETFVASNPRITLMRNMAVQEALDMGCTHILWLDPDMAPDRYIRVGQHGLIGRMRPFWDTAWHFIRNHPKSIVGAPYCGQPPDSPVHVFCTNEEGKLVRVPREVAIAQRGVTRVHAIGTGLVLMDLSIMEHLPKPWFEDNYSPDGVKLINSQDVVFSVKAGEYKVPIYCAWDCWAGHNQLSCVEMPDWQEPELPEPDNTIPTLRIRGKGDTSWNK